MSSTVFGIIPAAGKARRLPFLPFSKELLPVRDLDKKGEIHPVIEHVLAQFTEAGANSTLIIISRDKFDILRYLGDGKKFNSQFAYLVQDEQRGMPFALDQAYPIVGESDVVFGMPDTMFGPPDAVKLTLDSLHENQADLVLGLFPTTQPQKFGMVDFDPETNRYIHCIDKPRETALEFMWGVAAWNSKFTQYLHTFVSQFDQGQEALLGDVFEGAHKSGLRVLVRPFTQGKYVDIGTTDDWERNNPFI